MPNIAPQPDMNSTRAAASNPPSCIVFRPDDVLCIQEEAFDTVKILYRTSGAHSVSSSNGAGSIASISGLPNPQLVLVDGDTKRKTFIFVVSSIVSASRYQLVGIKEETVVLFDNGLKVHVRMPLEQAALEIRRKLEDLP